MGGVICCAFLSFVAIILTNYYMNVEGYDFPLLIYAGPVYLWIIFFMLGIFMSKYPDKPYFQWGAIIAITGLFLEIIESDYWLRIYGKGIGIKTSSFIFSVGIILILLSIRMQRSFSTSKFTKVIAWIGEVSFGVYLIHTYCIALFSHLLDIDNWAFMWFISLALTLIIIVVMKRFVSTRILRRYFGF